MGGFNVLDRRGEDIVYGENREGGGGYSHILAKRVCAAGEGMVFKPLGLVEGLVIIENWSSIGSHLPGSLTKD